MRYLDEARKLGSRLVVAVNDDASVARLKGLGRPVNPLAQRIAVLAALKPVDWVVPFSENARRMICRVSPNVLVKGGDYAVTEIAGHDCVTAAGGKVVTLRYQEGFFDLEGPLGVGPRARGRAPLILVTGGAGFIGSQLIKGLNANGHDDIVVVDNLERGEKLNNLTRCRIWDYWDKG